MISLVAKTSFVDLIAADWTVAKQLIASASEIFIFVVDSFDLLSLKIWRGLYSRKLLRKYLRGYRGFFEKKLSGKFHYESLTKIEFIGTKLISINW